MLNERNDCFCERIVFPHTKSIETNTPLNEFDILSFSIHHTTGYFNMIEMLKKDGIPVLRDDRTENDPLIIAGGPCITANPMPVKDFIDICWIGEVENGLYDFVDTYKKFENPKICHAEVGSKIAYKFLISYHNSIFCATTTFFNSNHFQYKLFT